MKKADLRLDGWLKEAAPSAALRRWFGHDPAKWADFQRRYFSDSTVVIWGGYVQSYGNHAALLDK
jgi:hypothetical protein